MTIDTNKIRRKTDEALTPKGPERFTIATVETGVKYWIGYLEKEIEREAGMGHRCASIMLRSDCSVLTRSFERSDRLPGDSDWVPPRQHFGYYSKEQMAYDTTASNLAEVPRKIYQGIHDHFTRAGFLVSIQYFDPNPMGDCPTEPAICVVW